MAPSAPLREHLADSPRLTIVALTDTVIDELGHDPRSAFAERFWLPVIGPGSLAAARNLVAGLEQAPEGYEVDVATLGRCIGLGGPNGRNARVVRTLERLTRFGMAEHHPSHSLYRVRRRWPPLTRRQLARLPEELIEQYLAA